MTNIIEVSRLELYSFFVKYSILDNYGFTAGALHRVFRKLIPRVGAENSFESYLVSLISKKEDAIVPSQKIIKHLLNNSKSRQSVTNDLDKAIKVLSLKVVSFGLDHEIQKLFYKLGIDSSCYDKLAVLTTVDQVSDKRSDSNLEAALDEVNQTIIDLRNKKHLVGTSLHLTVLTKRVLEHLKRTKDLVILRSDLDSVDNWERILSEYILFIGSRNSLRKYIGSHIDLLALEIVEHTSNTGEKYVADDFIEYKRFFRKGLIGGAIIAFFALFKILLDAQGLTGFSLALSYSINYGLCFIIVQYIGGTIATKQPAMTASTIIKHIDRDNDLQIDAKQNIILLLRKVFRSQFISLLGNFIMAFSLACVIAYIIRIGIVINPISSDKSNYLLNQVFPFDGGAMFYAAVAGIFLSLAGLISGYVDNKILASNMTNRIIHNPSLQKLLTKKHRESTAIFVKKNSGIIAGNISLGFLLGSAFLLSSILPFSLDIRHIAFSSSNLGYAVINSSFDFVTILIAIASVLLIGLVNLSVSFTITFLLALKSRSISLSDLGALFRMSIKDFVKHPLHYLIYRSNNSMSIKLNS